MREYSPPEPVEEWTDAERMDALIWQEQQAEPEVGDLNSLEAVAPPEEDEE